MTRLARTIAIALITITVSAMCPAADVAPAIAKTVVQPALDGIFKAFESHPLVGLGDDHGLAQAMDLYAEIVRSPRFAREVGNVIVEFGASSRQDVLDRYLAGETVPYTELRTVWTDTVGWVPTAGYLGFARFFAAVRKTNKTLPPGKRIRVWLGEPPIDWSAATRSDVMGAMSARDSHPAELVSKEILAKGRKALVIYGAFHLTGRGTLGSRIEAEHPGTFFVVLPFSGYHHPAACGPLLEQAEKIWPTAALAAPAAGGTPDAVMRECATLQTPRTDSPSAARPFDGVLFFGRIESLTRGPFLPDYVLDTNYRLEVSQHSQAGGPPLVRFPPGFSLRKTDYNVDLDAPGYAELIDSMFAKHDKNGDGIVTADEYEDPIPR